MRKAMGKPMGFNPLKIPTDLWGPQASSGTSPSAVSSQVRPSPLHGILGTWKQHQHRGFPWLFSWVFPRDVEDLLLFNHILRNSLSFWWNFNFVRSSMVDKCRQKDSMVDRKPCSFPMKYGYFRGKPVTPGYLSSKYARNGNKIIIIWIITSSNPPIPFNGSMGPEFNRFDTPPQFLRFLGGSERSSSELFGGHTISIDQLTYQTKKRRCLKIAYHVSYDNIICQQSSWGPISQHFSSGPPWPFAPECWQQSCHPTWTGRHQKTRAVGQISISGILKPIMLKHQEVF